MCLSQDIVVRICFILGNMTSRDDNFRLTLHKFKISSTIEKLLDHYQSCDAAVDDNQTESQSITNGTITKSKVEDVLIKVRFFKIIFLVYNWNFPASKTCSKFNCELTSWRTHCYKEEVYKEPYQYIRLACILCCEVMKTQECYSSDIHVYGLNTHYIVQTTDHIRRVLSWSRM